MATREEMQEALDQVRAYCRDYKGKHEAVFGDLGGRLQRGEINTDVSADVRFAFIKDQYLDAISTLLSLALPPGTNRLVETLQKLGNVVETPLEDVRVFEDDGERNYQLSQALPGPRRTTRFNKELLAHFREQVPEPAWLAWRKDDSNGRN